MSEYIVDTFGIVQDFADLHGDMNTPLYQAIMDVMVSRQREEIVRCKDCQFFKPYEALKVDGYKCTRVPTCFSVEPDSFCSFGERIAANGGDSGAVR